MDADWQDITLADICHTNTSTYSEKEKWEYVDYLDTGNITQGVIETLQHFELPQEKLPSRARRKVHPNDIIYSTVRPNQLHYGFMNEVPDNFLVSTGFTVITVDPSRADPKFVYYFLTQDYITQSLHSIAEQSVTSYPSIKASDIEALDVSLPSIEEQRKIASILSALDDKIALNQKINANLQAQAAAVFKSWFVDFEPWGGEMPEGWSYTSLADIAEFFGGYSYKGNELLPSSCAMATIKNFVRNGGFKMDGLKEIIPSSKVKPSHEVEKFDILVAHTDLTQKAEVIGNAEYLLSKGRYQKIIMSMDVAKVVPKDERYRFVIGSMLHSSDFKNHCLGYVNGTTVLHLNKRALHEYTMPFPQMIEDVMPLNAILKSFYTKIANLYDESLRLAAIRDALLPRLMSGEIDVSGIELG